MINHGAQARQQRFEVKYLVPSELKTEVTHRVRAYTRPDPNLPKGQHDYRVRSLYFDTADFDAYHEKQAGLLRRSKFRVRTYPGTEPVWFLERKQRFSNRITKPKTRLTRDQYEALMMGRLPRFEEQPEVMQQFLRESARARLWPQLYIEYRRRPLVGKFDTRLRVTMDEDITVSRAHGRFEQGTTFPVLDRGKGDSGNKVQPLLPGLGQRIGADLLFERPGLQ